jgi:hypothetical protein
MAEMTAEFSIKTKALEQAKDLKVLEYNHDYYNKESE